MNRRIALLLNLILLAFCLGAIFLWPLIAGTIAFRQGSAEEIAYKALKIASEICVFTNDHITVETV